MSYKVTSHINQIDNDTNQRMNIFLRLMSDQIVDISTPKTPKRTGRLRADIVKSVLGLKGSVRWGKGYAIFQETKQFRNYTTPGTGPHFAENAVKQAVLLTGNILRRVI